ncbi:MAG TPA: disulfide bond formation protein B [Xanthobacteraceae bacterium]|jgi:disulfide bond formation protein DsbB|nr:disulfide bond formation protein B [Xanthobacteraceae bacterium]
MPISLPTAIRHNGAAAAAFIVAGVGTATILGAYYFEYVLGMAPCELCLKERIPYYVSIPLALVIGIAALRGAPHTLVRAGLAVIMVAMLIVAGLSVYHAGVEWKFWPGPTDCSGPISGFGNAGSLLESMEKTVVIRCDEAAWRLFGISLAGYDVLISLGLAAVALAGILAPKKA